VTGSVPAPSTAPSSPSSLIHSLPTPGIVQVRRRQ
jgi:hypothetical protein